MSHSQMSERPFGDDCQSTCIINLKKKMALTWIMSLHEHDDSLFTISKSTMSCADLHVQTPNQCWVVVDIDQEPWFLF